MQLEIDTEARLIKIKGRVSINELFKTLGKMFPEMEFGDWSITDESINTGIWNQIKTPPWTGTGNAPQIGSIHQGLRDYGMMPLTQRDFGQEIEVGGIIGGAAVTKPTV